MIDILVSRNKKTGDVVVHQIFDGKDYPDLDILVDTQVKLSQMVDSSFPSDVYDTQIISGRSLEEIYNAYPLFAPKE